MQRRAQCLVDQQTRLSIKWGRGQWQVGLFSTNAVCSSEIYETLLIEEFTSVAVENWPKSLNDEKYKLVLFLMCSLSNISRETAHVTQEMCCLAE